MAEQSNRKLSKREFRKEPGQDIAPKNMPPGTYFFQVGPNSCLSLLPIMPLYCESTKGSINSLGPSIKDLNVSGNVLPSTPKGEWWRRIT
jgi:hypothetical protein